MPAYVIALIDVTNPDGYAPYRDMAHASITKYGGRYLARGGRSEVLEGEPEGNRFVVLEFPSYERAQEWWNSPEYEEAKPVRRDNSTATMVLVDGLP